jgi:WXXGXW repeat (2 copies)
MKTESMNNSRRKVLRLSSAGPLHAVLAAALLIVMQTSSTARVYVGIAPPVPIVEVVPAAPGPGYYWIPGYWIWDGGRYVWRHGYYAIRPGPAAVWVPGHWSHHVRGWYWGPGHWRH